MSDVHELAARGFERGAEEYERGRPSYPPQAVAFLVETLGLAPGRTVCDLGAGTGKLTRLLVPSGADVVAVEPVAAMRERLAAALPTVRALAGTAEALPLPDRSVDAVVVAQAFHWFRAERALAEIHRALAPGGRLALVWNVRDESVAWVRRLSDLLAPYETGAPRYRHGGWREAFAASAGFTPLAERRFRHEQELDRDGLVARVTSVSFVSTLPAEERSALAERVLALVGDRERVVLPYETDVYWCERREPPAGV